MISTIVSSLLLTGFFLQTTPPPENSTTTSDKLGNESAGHSRDSADARKPDGTDVCKPEPAMGPVVAEASGAPFLSEAMTPEEESAFREIKDMMERCCGLQACFKPNCGCVVICQFCKGNGLCSNCEGTNRCPYCKGGRCSLCDGTGKCLTCKGSPGPCPFCEGGTAVCPGCRGTKIGHENRLSCSACEGQGRVERCPTCKGSRSVIEVQIPCSRCGGAGKFTSIFGTDTCSTCWGSGQVPMGMGRCKTCFGHGSITVYPKDCSRCGGTRVDPDSKKGCERCNGAGSVRCTYCSGKGQWCQDCHGSGLCPRTGNSGTCVICRGEDKCLKHEPKCAACKGSGRQRCVFCKGGCCP